MIPTEFEYLRPRSMEEALGLLAQHGPEAKLLAGGHSLLPLMKLRLAAPKYLIDLGGLEQLSYVRDDGPEIAIGAMTPHAEVESSELIRRRCPLLAEAAAEIGDVQVRNRGTMGGSLAHADPGADYPAAILALEAKIKVRSREGERTIDAASFFLDLLTTALQPREIILEVRVAPDRERSGAAYVKLHQPASGFAIVGTAARLMLDPKGNCETARIGVTGVGAKAYRAEAVEKALAGKRLTAALLAKASAMAAEGVEPLSDLHASAAYRLAMAEVITKRALEKALDRARGGRK